MESSNISRGYHGDFAESARVDFIRQIMTSPRTNCWIVRLALYAEMPSCIIPRSA